MTTIKTVLISAFCLLSGCGGGGGDSSWSGPINSEGFPEVQGTYTVNYSETTYTCSDGTSSSSPAVSKNITVTQNGSNLDFAASDNGFVAGVVVTHESDATGPIASDGEFSATRGIEGVVEPSTSIAINSVYNGQFSPAGFSGNVQSTALFPSVNGTCTYNATFDATKIS